MPREDKEKARKLAAIIFIVTLVVLLALIGYFAFKLLGRFAGGGRGETVAVPDLAGKTEEEAEDALRELSLAPRPPQRIHSTEQKAGLVFRQKPSPGSKVKPGNRVTYWVSLGPPTFTIPDLIGERIEKVSGRLTEVNLALGKVEKVLAPGSQTGVVISQRPEPGSVYNGTVPVDIVVVDNENVPEIEMPSLNGMSIAEVEQTLVDLNLHLSEVNYVGSDEANSGTVVKQNIEPGKKVKLGTKVSLEVAVPTALRDAPTRTVNLRITVPVGPEQQRVRIKFFDDLGTTEDYNEVHSRGHTIERTISIEGPATIYIFINDMSNPYRVEKL